MAIQATPTRGRRKLQRRSGPAPPRRGDAPHAETVHRGACSGWHDVL